VLGPVELVDEVDSTNRVLLDRARAGAPAGLVLVADYQTAGRGRLDRTWEAALGAALLVSVLLRPALPPARVHLLTLAAALAARDACTQVAGVTPTLKWPNDVVIERGEETSKLAGLLAESLIEGGRVTAVVLGMGLNLRASGVPEGGVALESLSGQTVPRDVLLGTWLAAFEMLLDPWDESALLDTFTAACSTIGRHVRVELAGRSFAGRAIAIDADGQLLVEADGGTESISAGDVVHLRRV
jgi:BirA family transcriptional regulator, biotin operon repressor / biotin---[acetyl-CoA-carboxylase] ligase